MCTITPSSSPSTTVIATEMARIEKMKILGALIGVMYIFVVAESTPNTAINYWRCNANEYSQNDPYADNVEYVLADVMNVTPNAGYNYYTQSPSTTAIAYGHGTCSAALSYNDCADCLTAIRASVKSICNSKIGGTVQMADCTVRYENYSFS